MQSLTRRLRHHREELVATAFLLVAVVVVGILGFVVTTRLVAEEARAYVAGYIATVAGIAVGVPIALIISRWQGEAEQQRTRDDRQNRRQHLLKALMADLEEIGEELAGRMDDRDPGRAIAPFLGTGLWETIKASGQGELLEDQRLTREVTRAYDRIAVTAYLERLHWEIAHDPQARMRTVPPLTLIEDAGTAVLGQDRHTAAAIDVARGEIDKHIERLDI